ncbi:signal peptidase I [Thermomonospora umbrina]|uniref:Signal peptidase I n=1 Tax=Thermomonospora umbrina TaxID=111806 RepID=A0A3D9SSB6_9ACTN|nr:signal peptidase I [Thermomonospora umbrina]REE96863.1 signal peptidase I [Thermomonospora umbrina]
MSSDADTGNAPPDEESRKKKRPFWRELPVLVGGSLLLAFALKVFLVQAFFIPSGSMENTLQVGDRVLVNKFVYRVRDIKRGETVVFNGLDSWDAEAPRQKDYIKRVIGIAGDHIKCCDSQGRITVNGVPLNEGSYLYRDPRSGVRNRPSALPFETVVPPGSLWVMGDHRDVSRDSRLFPDAPGGGAIPESRVIGRAFVIVWPLRHIGKLPVPETFDGPAQKAADALPPAAPFVVGPAFAVPWFHRRRRTWPGIAPRSGEGLR